MGKGRGRSNRGAFAMSGYSVSRASAVSDHAPGRRAGAEADPAGVMGTSGVGGGGGRGRGSGGPAWGWVPASIMVGLVVTSCAVGPDYRRPDVPAPETWRDPQATADPASLADLSWWELFQDDEL